MRELIIDNKIMLRFQQALIESKKQISDLLKTQQELGQRKKSENWMIFLSNKITQDQANNAVVKKNPGGYKYVEVVFHDSKNTRIVCHLVYLKKRSWFPRNAIYRDIPRQNNPSSQQEFDDVSFKNISPDLYYLFCFGEDKNGLFGNFRQPDSILSEYYAESVDCMNLPMFNFEADKNISEVPDTEVFTFNSDKSNVSSI
jgi:hypothetical protein